jgi:hypothetical protein
MDEWIRSLPSRPLTPPLPHHEIPRIGERHRIPVARRREIHGARRLVVLVVVLALHHACRAAELEVWLIGGGGGSSEGACGGREGKDEGAEGYHFVGLRRWTVGREWKLGRFLVLS